MWGGGGGRKDREREEGQGKGVSSKAHVCSTDVRLLAVVKQVWWPSFSPLPITAHQKELLKATEETEKRAKQQLQDIQKKMKVCWREYILTISFPLWCVLEHHSLNRSAHTLSIIPYMDGYI